MDSFLHFADKNFLLLFGITAVWVFLGFGWRWLKRIRKGSIFPEIAPGQIRYQERTASGRSYKNWYTKLGGANNCLKLVVTDDELWVTSFFPFVLLVNDFDLEHRILKRNIISVKEGTSFGFKTLLIDFRNEAGGSQTG